MGSGGDSFVHLLFYEVLTVGSIPCQLMLCTTQGPEPAPQVEITTDEKEEK